MSSNLTQKYLCCQPAPQPVNVLSYCPACCKLYGIIFARKTQCKCCQRYFCSSCIDNRTKYCSICEKHINSQKGCIGVLSTYFNDGNDQCKLRAFNEFLLFWSDSLYTVEDLIKGGMIPPLLNILKFKEFHLTLIEILLFAIKKDIHVRNMIDSNAFCELARFTEYHRKIMFLLGTIAVSCMKGSKEGEYQTIGEVIQVFEKAYEFVQNENYQLKEYRKEFIESKENKEGELIERILGQFASEEMLNLLNQLYSEAVEEKRIVEVMYRFFACSIDVTKCKISDGVWKKTIQSIDSHNAQSIITVLIAYSKTNKTVAPFLNGGLLSKLEMLLDRQDRENNNAICDVLFLFKSFPTLFCQLTANDNFLEIVFKTIKQEDYGSSTATSILQDIIDSGDSSKYHLSEVLIENHPDLIELLISNSLRTKKLIGLELCKVLLNTFGDEASVVLLSRGIIDRIISLSRMDDELLLKCYKILRIAAQYHREIVSHYIQTSFICTLFVNIKTNPLQSIIAINEFIQYENVKEEIIHSSENILSILDLLKQNDVKILHETLILLNIVFKYPLVFKVVQVPLLPLLLPLFKILPIQSFAILLQVIATVIPHINITEKDSMIFVDSSILFLNQQTYEPLLQSVYTTFSIAVKTTQIRDIFIHGDSNDIEADGYFSFLVCSINQETSLTLKASQLQFFTQFIIKGNEDSKMALDILKPLITFIQKYAVMLPNCNSFILESLNYLIAVLLLEIPEQTTFIYQSGILPIYFRLAYDWKATQIDLMVQFIKLIMSLYDQIKSLFSECPAVSSILPRFLSYTALPISSVNQCLFLFNQMKQLHLPVILTPSCIHLLLLTLKERDESNGSADAEFLLTIPNATTQYKEEIDLLLHSHIHSLRSLGFTISKQWCNETMFDGLLTMTWEILTKDDMDNIIQILHIWRKNQILKQHQLIGPMLHYLSENSNLISGEYENLLFEFVSEMPFTPYHIDILKNHLKNVDEFSYKLILSIPSQYLREEANWLLTCVASQTTNENAIFVAIHLLSDPFIQSFLEEQTQLIFQFVDALPNTLPILLHCASQTLQPLLLISIDFHDLILRDSRALKLLIPSTWYSKDYIGDALRVLRATNNVQDIANVVVFINSIADELAMIQIERTTMIEITKEFIKIIEEQSEQIEQIQIIGDVIIKLVSELGEVRKECQMDRLFEQSLRNNNCLLLEIVIKLIKMGMIFDIKQHTQSIQNKLIEMPQLLEVITMYFIVIRKDISPECIIKTIYLCSQHKIMKNQILLLLLNCVRCEEWRKITNEMVSSNVFVDFIEEMPLFKNIKSLL